VIRLIFSMGWAVDMKYFVTTYSCQRHLAPNRPKRPVNPQIYTMIPAFIVLLITVLVATEPESPGGVI
jgi:hypothetical protein